MKQFSELELHSSLANALKKLNFETPTPIQAQAIPHALAGKDILGTAETGSGKTMAYLLPALQKIETTQDAKVLVLVPTRELAQQVNRVFQQLSRADRFGPGAAVLIGGVPAFGQRTALRARPKVIIATPGRLMDHVRQKNVNLKEFNILVIDEADRMFDVGFAPQINEILQFMPTERQTMMFTATLSKDVQRLAEASLKNPERVAIGQVSKTNENIQQEIMELDTSDKNDALLDLINAHDSSVLVFSSTKHRTDKVARFLESYGVAVARLHGDRSQGQRTQALRGFRNNDYKVMVATDIAARGIDIDHIGLVINYDLPRATEDYVHRIGRTGRAGRSGRAVSFVSPDEAKKWRDIERMNRPRLPRGAKPPKNQKPLATRVEYIPSDNRPEKIELPPEGRERSFGGGRRKDGGRPFGRSRDGGRRPERDRRPEGGRERGERFRSERFRKDFKQDSADAREFPRRQERSERFDRPERAARSERADKFENFDRPKSFDRSKKFSRSERPERFDRPERTDKFERFGRSERSSRPERREREDRFPPKKDFQRGKGFIKRSAETKESFEPRSREPRAFQKKPPFAKDGFKKRSGSKFPGKNRRPSQERF